MINITNVFLTDVMTVVVFMVVFGNFFYEITHIAMRREGFSTFNILKFILVFEVWGR